MTNNEAIRILELECDDWETSHCSPSDRKEAFNMAISALKTEAIPVEWIYEYLSQWDEISNKYERPFDDDALADKEYWKVISKRADIGMMICEWRKGNESRITDRSE